MFYKSKDDNIVMFDSHRAFVEVVHHYLCFHGETEYLGNKQTNFGDKDCAFCQQYDDYGRKKHHGQICFDTIEF